MNASVRPTPALEGRWSQPRVAERYSGPRWGSSRAARRDPRMVERALARHAGDLSDRHILDIPCGAGRLRSALEASGARYVGVDVSAEMLEQAPPDRLVRASAFALPFADAAFDVVVCCRLLHHLTDGAARSSLLSELARVSSGLVLVSYWDAASLHAWRRRHGLRRRAHADRRVAVPRSELVEYLAAAGADTVGSEHSLRFISSQAFLVARKRG